MNRATVNLTGTDTSGNPAVEMLLPSIIDGLAKSSIEETDRLLDVIFDLLADLREINDKRRTETEATDASDPHTADRESIDRRADRIG